jgi:hypothetical protein
VAAPFTHRFPGLELDARIVETWKEALAEKLGLSTADLLLKEGLALYAPPDQLGVVRIELADGSFAEFRDAFFLVDEPRAAIVIVSEHCGCHVFSVHESRVMMNGIAAYRHVPGKLPK